MAEAVLAQALAGTPGLRVESAGFNALVGRPADPTSIALMQERGLSIEAHRARQFTADMARDFELILVMEQGHVNAVAQLSPTSRGKIFRLGKWSDFDIPDPYRRPRMEFERALSLIDKGVVDLKKVMGHAG